jgi:lipooligosaccharide transport system permease protein
MGRPDLRPEADAVTLLAAVASSRLADRFGGSRRSLRVVERELRAYESYRLAFLTGMLEPMLYLLSIGVGVGELVGRIPGPGGTPISYEKFVAPALLANAAMSGAIFDSTFNFFVKFKYARTFDAMLATPLSVADVTRGELAWSLARGGLYAAVFLVAMVAFGLVASWWGVLAVPIALLVGFAFSGAGLAATTYMRSWVDFDLVTLAMVPMFLFSATFFPLERYPAAVEAVVRLTPLYQGVALSRAVVLGDVHVGLVWHAVYLVVMGWAGLRVASRHLGRLLQP